MRHIEFFYPYPIKVNEDQTSSWLLAVVKAEGHELQQLSLYFLSSAALRELNREHLDHDYETDVITFDHSFDQGVCADIMISPMNVKENADELGVPLRDELDRVMVHGLLHLLGYDDIDDSLRRVMREKEDHYLTLRPF